MRYVISYDLNAPETINDYKKLTAALKELGAQKILYSQWVVRRYQTTAENLAKHCWQFMDANDRLLVTSLDSADWYSFNLMMNPNTI